MTDKLFYFRVEEYIDEGIDGTREANGDIVDVSEDYDGSYWLSMKCDSPTRRM